jgi:hypothetical protein
MNKGTRVILCIIAVVLIMIAERGIPVKLTRSSIVVYLIIYCSFVSMVDGW